MNYIRIPLNDKVFFHNEMYRFFGLDKRQVTIAWALFKKENTIEVIYDVDKLGVIAYLQDIDGKLSWKLTPEFLLSIPSIEVSENKIHKDVVIDETTEMINLLKNNDFKSLPSFERKNIEKCFDNILDKLNKKLTISEADKEFMDMYSLLI